MAKRQAVKYLQSAYGASERRTYQVISIDRSSHRRQPKKHNDRQLLSSLHALSYRYPRFGYCKIHVKLNQQGECVSRERVRLLRRVEGLSLRPLR